MTDLGDTIEIVDKDRIVSSPLVSVYMLTYKHEKFIEDAIKGVLEQKTSFPYELIIGEDCSPDSTLDIIKSYQKRYPKIIRIITGSSNVGAYKNSYRCRTACRGKYIAACEGDDFWHHPEKLQMQVDLMEKNSQMVVCHTDFNRLEYTREYKNVHQKSSYTPAQGQAYETLLLNWHIITATSMCRRDVAEGFINSSFHNERWPFGDLNFALYASQQGQIGYIDKSTATWRKVHGSATNSGFSSALHMELCAIECIEIFMNHYPVSTELRIRAIAKRMLSAWRLAYFSGDKETMGKAAAWLAQHNIHIDKKLMMLRNFFIKFSFLHNTHLYIKSRAS